MFKMIYPWENLVKIFQARQRVNFEKSRDIYNEDMQSKVNFIMRKNRKDAYPGC